MPLYEYQCKKCRHIFEKIQKFSDRPVKKCPKCGAPVERLLSAPAVQFKGSGWYVTDYARSGGGSDKDKSKAADSAPASSTEKDAAKSSDKGDKSEKSESAKKTTKTETK